MSKTIIVRTVGSITTEASCGYVVIVQEDINGGEPDSIVIPMELIPRLSDCLYQHLADFEQAKGGDAP